jgi:hypothetical protein
MKRRPALWLTIVLVAFYILLGNDRITSGDGEAMFQVTRALAQQGRLDLPSGILPPVETILADSADTQIPYTLVGQGGRTYSKYGLGQSLAALPLYLLGMAWRYVTGIVYAPRSAALLLNCLLTAGTAGLLVTLARNLGYSTRTGMLLALAYALCSPAWVYTHTFFSEPLATLCLTGAALSAIRFAQGGNVRWLVLSGGALGFALLTRLDAVAALPAFGLYLALVWNAQDHPFSAILRQIAATLLGFSLGVGLMLLHNLVRFGSPLDFGYHTANWQTPFLRGLYGLTISPGKGILWYAPAIVLGLFGLRPFSRRWPHETVLCAGVPTGYLVLHSPYTYWAGGWCWGPRFILPALPFLLLPASALLDRRDLPKAAELGLALLLAIGLVGQIPAVGSSYAYTLQQAYQASPEDFEARILYQPRHSPLLTQWTSFLQTTANLRDAGARAQLADLLGQTEPEDEVLLLADSPSAALRIQRQALLAFNLPDLWLVSAPWLRQDGSP